MCCPGISKDVQGRELWVSTEHCVQWWLFPANCKNNGCQRSETVTITTLSSFINTIIITNAVCYWFIKGFFRVKIILKHAEYIMSKVSQCKALRSSKGLGDLESAIATNNGEPITRPNIIIVIFWVHHETKYLCCHFSGKHQILFSLDFLSLSVLILCLMIQRTQRKASIGYDILFANSRDIYVLQGSGYK